MDIDEDFIQWNTDDQDLLDELRCKENTRHRIWAASLLVERNDQDHLQYLTNAVLYDPDPKVRAQIKRLLSDVYGNELETILQVEGMDGVPLESPWLVPCGFTGKPVNNLPGQETSKLPENWGSGMNLEELHDALRDPLEVKNRLAAATKLAQYQSEENLEMLAKAVLFDPDENVQQKAYESLYQAAGAEKADALINQIGTNSPDDEWLLIPDYYDEDQNSAGNKEEPSLFGLTKDDQLRGMVNLFTGESNPQKRIALLNAIARSSDMNVNGVIGRVGLFDADKRVRELAKTILENRLGDQLDEFLEHIYNTASAYHPDPDDEVEDMETQNDVEIDDDFSEQLRSQPSVVNEGTNWNPLILISILVILGLVLFMIFK